MELSADTFRILVDSIQDYAIYLLAPDGTIRSWNAGAQRLKGYTGAEIIGQSFERFFSPEDRRAGRPASLLRRALTDGRVEDVGWRFRKDGSPFWASALITTLRDDRGEHIGFAKVTRDLTDRSYRAFVEATHAIVWTTDATGRPNADSPTWREFTGQTEAEWRDLHGWDPVHPDDLEAMRAAWTTAKAEGTRFAVEFRMRRADGAYVWMGASAVPMLEPDGRVREWFGVTFDISARKRAEEDKEQALQLWRTTLQSIGDAVISTDAAGRVRFLNAVAERLTGWSLVEATDRPLAEVFAIADEETGAPRESPVDRVVRGHGALTLEEHTVLRRRGGGVVPIDDSIAPILDPDGKIVGAVLVFRDASDEKRELVRRSLLANATQQLVEATDYRDALARIAQLAVPRLADWVSVDIAEGLEGRTEQVALAHVDPAKVDLARTLGRKYPPDPHAAQGVPNVIRTGRSELYPELGRDRLERAARDEEHRRLIRQLDLQSAIVVPLRGRTEVFGALTFVYAGGDRRYTNEDLEFAEELANRAALVIERRRLEEEAESASRMKDEFLATMSHELRTPLQAIVGYGSMLKHGTARDPEKAIDAIVRSADAQTRLVEDILDASRVASGKLRLTMANVDIAATVRAALDAVRPAAQVRRLTLVEDVPDRVGTVQGDADRLQQEVWNLLSNATKFTEPGGTIEVHLTSVDGSVRLAVRDTGKGIPPQHLGRVFERFQQLDASTTRGRGGLGLGLAIVRYLVEAHGGTVEADSQGLGTVEADSQGLGTGSTFTVTLPAAGPSSTLRAPATAGELFAAHPLRGLRVLLVDDDDDVLESMADVLSEAGAAVTTAGSAAEALQAVRSGPPHILVTDIGMPVEDGHSLLRRVRALPVEKGGAVPAIALTAYARPEDLRKATEAGFQFQLVKPVKPEALLDAISVWARR